MSAEIRDRLKELETVLKTFEAIFDVETKEKRLEEIGKMMTAQIFGKGVRPLKRH